MYPPHHLGGYEVVWQGAMRRARESGHEVRVLASDHREPGVTGEDDPDVHRTLKWYWSWGDYSERSLTPVQKLRLERANGATVDRHLREFEPQVVTWWPMGGMSLTLPQRVDRTGIPSVFVVHDDWLNYAPRMDGWLRLWSPRRRRPAAALAAWTTGIPTRFEPRSDWRMLFNSQFMLARAEQRLTLENAIVISPGIELRFQNAAEERPWSWRLLCVGRVDRQKGVDTAIGALQHLPEEATLTIAGSGEATYIDELKDQAARVGVRDRVLIKGFVSSDEMPAELADADVVVFPVRWEEPWGLVPLEAMGVGRPVVSTARGGSVEYLRQGENALLFLPDDARALAQAVSRLAGDADLRRGLVAGGQETARRHTAAEFEQQIVEELERAAR
jgi:glycogen(starch) synthase